MAQAGETVESTPTSVSTTNLTDQPTLSAYLNLCDSKSSRFEQFKKRWVTYNGQECRVYFYRAKGDLVPLGKIDIRRATFTINPHHPLASDKSSLVFSILTPDSEYLLEGVDKETSMYWIKELQRLRRNFVLDIADSEFGVEFTPSQCGDGIAIAKSDSSSNASVNTTSENVQSNSVFYSSEKNHSPVGHLSNSTRKKNTTSSPAASAGGMTAYECTDETGKPPVVRRTKSQEQNSHDRQRRSIGSTFLSRVRSRAESLTRHNSSGSGNGNSSKSYCEKCKEKDEHIITISDDLTAVENELQATREVIHLLQRQLDIAQSEKDKLHSLIRVNSSEVKDELLQSLSSLELELGDVTAKLTCLQRKFDRLTMEKERLSDQVIALTDEVCVLRDTVEAKDKTVINLTNEIFELESSSCNGRAASTASAAAASPLTDVTRRRRSGTHVTAGKQSSITGECKDEIETLSESINAYKMQNEFLNQEIVALNELRVIAERKQQELQLKTYEWEAKCCQVHSKLLSLLKEMKQSINGTLEMDSSSVKQEQVVLPESTIDLVKRLLQDMSLDIPLSWQKGNRRRLEAPSILPSSKFNNRSSQYDDLGFSSSSSASTNYLSDSSGATDIHKHMGDMQFDSTANKTSTIVENTAASTSASAECNSTSSPPPATSSMQVSPSSSGNTMKYKVNHTRDDDSRNVRSQSVAWKNRWDTFVASLGNQELTLNQELKFLLRSGIPREYRCKIWKSLVNFRVAQVREAKGRDYYQTLLDNKQYSRNGDTEQHTKKGNSASTGCSSTFKSFDPIAKQIELDLLRTLPNNRHFESLESDGTCRLRRVLTAFSRHNCKIGYCQGLNRVAAVSLLFMPEEEAFWALVAIVEYLMPPNYYSHNLLGAHVDQHVFRDLLSEKLPRISEVLEKLGIEISLFSWFLTCFVDNIPVEVYLRIWDVFLYEGNKVCNVNCVLYTRQLFSFSSLFFFFFSLRIFLSLLLFALFITTHTFTYAHTLTHSLSLPLPLFFSFQVLFRFALAFFKLHEEEILSAPDSVSVNTLLRTLGERECDVRTLCKIAFSLLNPFPMSKVRSKRAYYQQVVSCELERLEQIRRTFPTVQDTEEVDRDSD